MLKITPSEAMEFYNSLCEKHRGLMTAEDIAKTMEMEITDALLYCFAMVYYGITEKQGDGYAI